jgi:hypothetical protein
MVPIPIKVEGLTSWLKMVPELPPDWLMNDDLDQPQRGPWGDLEIGGDCEAIQLPQSEPIPQQHWTVACSWIPIVGRDIVACLFSRDWLVRFFLDMSAILI